MFKLAKYYLLVNIYKRAKFSVVFLLASLLAMLVISLVFTDLTLMINGSGKMVMIGIKWLILFLLLGSMIYHLRKIFKVASYSFKVSQDDEIVDKKRARLMKKEILLSRSELIFEKYRNAE